MQAIMQVQRKRRIGLAMVLSVAVLPSLAGCGGNNQTRTPTVTPPPGTPLTVSPQSGVPGSPITVLWHNMADKVYPAGVPGQLVFVQPGYGYTLVGRFTPTTDGLGNLFFATHVPTTVRTNDGQEVPTRAGISYFMAMSALVLVQAIPPVRDTPQTPVVAFTVTE